MDRCYIILRLVLTKASMEFNKLEFIKQRKQKKLFLIRKRLRRRKKKKKKQRRLVKEKERKNWGSFEGGC